MAMALVAGSVILLASCAATSEIPLWNIKLAQQQGPNVCVVEEVPGSQHRVWTECKYWNSREVCGTKPVLKYECCEGFQRAEGTQGCSRVSPLKNLLETARELGAGTFVTYLEQAGLAQELTDQGPFTLFVPSDEVFRDLPKEHKSRLQTRIANHLRPILQYHIAEGRITSSMFKANVLVPTKYSGQQLRINKYSSRVETVNCALIQRKDQEATNGVVHIIDSLLDPSFTVGRDLAELLVQDGRFKELSQALDKAGLMASIKAQDQPLTILAPSDEAFTKLRPSRLSKILNDKVALKDMLDMHILPNVICPRAIIGEHKVKSSGDMKITFDCDRRGVRIGNSSLHSDFTLGMNGVIHLMDSVLVPDRAKSLIQIMEEENFTSFLQLIRLAGLEDAFENFGEYTFFVPSETALNSLPPGTLKSMKINREMARKFVLFHVIQGRLTTDKMNNNQILTSLNEQYPLRVQLFRAGAKVNVEPRTMFAVEGVTLMRPDQECINGVVHIINRALFPVTLSAVEFLQRNGSYRLFLNAMEKVSVINQHLTDLSKPKTLFVPTDEAFQRIGEVRLRRMLSDLTYLNKTVSNHLCENMLVAEFIQPDLQYMVPSHLGTLTVTQEDGKTMVNDAEVLENNIITTSGVVHIINKVLLPEQNADG